jgi:hypothetical protein
VAISSVAKNIAKIQGSLFSGLMERARLQVQLALGSKLDKDIAALKDKYDGSDITGLESQVSVLSKQKEDLAAKVANLQQSTSRIGVIQEGYDELRDLADPGFPTDFDAILKNLNDNAGSAITRPGNYVGRNGHIGTQAEIVKLGPITTTINKSYQGSSYSIALDDGRTFQPDFSRNTLSGIAFSDLSVDSFDRTTGAIQFNDGTNTYNGTLTRSGGGVLSAWLYNNFAAQGDVDNAKADVASALKRTKKADDGFRNNLSIISGNVSNLDDGITKLNSDIQTTAKKDLDNLQAEEKALQTKFDLAMSSYSLTTKINTDFITSLFLAPDPGEKKDVFDVISSTIG